MFSKRLEYGYFILKSLKNTSEKDLKSGKEILTALTIPYSMGLTILSELAAANLIKSIKGKNGGFYYPKKEISFLDLFQALENKKIMCNSLDSLNEYDSKILEIGTIVLQEMKKIKI